jgi:hypothetical protein
MSSYLNENISNAVSNALLRMHDTFSKKIYVFKQAEKTIVSTSPNYNSIYGKTNSGSKGNINYEMLVEEYYARIYYIQEDQEYLAKEGSQDSSQNKIILPKGSVRIVVTVDAYNAIKEAKRIEIDGRIFAIKSPGTDSGFLNAQLYHFHLTPIDE